MPNLTHLQRKLQAPLTSIPRLVRLIPLENLAFELFGPFLGVRGQRELDVLVPELPVPRVCGRRYRESS